MTQAGRRKPTLLLVSIVALTGCNERETPAQLHTWIDTARNTAMSIEQRQQQQQPQSIPAIAFTPFPYTATTDRTPFGSSRPIAIDIPYRRPSQRGDAQPLEDFPLESILMVGTISQEGRRHVLLQADSIVYQAKIGDYVGKNFGVIRHIAEDAIELEEMLPAAAGRWTTRQATLALQGKKQ